MDIAGRPAIYVAAVTLWLRAEVRRSFDPPWNAAIERAVFGVLSPDEIVDALKAGCQLSLGSALREGFLYEVSAGVVIGCQLANGRRLILKGYQPRWTPTFLAAVKRIERFLNAAGFPCPQPLDVEMRVGAAVMLAESVLPDPGVVATASAGARSQLAVGLAELVERCRHLDEPDLAEHPLRRPFHGAFPEPHSPIFDFDATRDGAEWIEDIALRARGIIEDDTRPPVIAHTDWSLRNVRVDATRVVAAYDWDSLALLRESEAVALAAATWSKTGRPDDSAPTIAEIDRYANAYEARRGEPFTAIERRAMHAAAIASMAYTARCEHAIDPHEQTWTTTRPRLREAAATLG